MVSRIHHGIANIHPLSFSKNLVKEHILIEDLLNFFINEQQIHERYVYICSPLKAHKEKSGRDHIMDSLKTASQISGASYQSKKLLLFIPHLHGLSIFNEFLHSEKRNHGIQFTTKLLQIIKPIIVVSGKRISGGMRGELNLAKKLDLTVFNFSDFKSKLEDLPLEKEIDQIFNLLKNCYPPDFLNHPAVSKK